MDFKHRQESLRRLVTSNRTHETKPSQGTGFRTALIPPQSILALVRRTSAEKAGETGVVEIKYGGQSDSHCLSVESLFICD